MIYTILVYFMTMFAGFWIGMATCEWIHGMKLKKELNRVEKELEDWKNARH